MGGLSLATFLTLVNLPALYVLVFRVRENDARAKASAGNGDSVSSVAMLAVGAGANCRRSRVAGSTGGASQVTSS